MKPTTTTKTVTMRDYARAVSTIIGVLYSVSPIVLDTFTITANHQTPPSPVPVPVPVLSSSSNNNTTTTTTDDDDDDDDREGLRRCEKECKKLGKSYTRIGYHLEIAKLVKDEFKRELEQRKLVLEVDKLEYDAAQRQQQQQQQPPPPPPPPPPSPPSPPAPRLPSPVTAPATAASAPNGRIPWRC
ncbi:hypothetical protein MAA_09782 [Metarhizium robertsii ARSEF 23]|uniref:Uncharacterized protein n=1 Tax=Metarhizium robertsii (strain ARSEF 23 / ATCC MYA-3075) TaxID=655844 RepID=E9FBY3_METRA|nr:uncharacterized protein MAA_09782 [Metarhizium robertsii ARSEF 23]EFY94754.2 hypothetical protein MAA_09782 [Metarhizium robertsii ARSEF 23]